MPQAEMEEDHYTVREILTESGVSTPLLANSAGAKSHGEEKWKPGPGFIWIEIGKKDNNQKKGVGVVSCSFHDADTGIQPSSRTCFSLASTGPSLPRPTQSSAPSSMRPTPYRG